MPPQSPCTGRARPRVHAEPHVAIRMRGRVEPSPKLIAEAPAERVVPAIPSKIAGAASIARRRRRIVAVHHRCIGIADSTTTAARAAARCAERNRIRRRDRDDDRGRRDDDRSRNDHGRCNDHRTTATAPATPGICRIDRCETQTNRQRQDGRDKIRNFHFATPRRRSAGPAGLGTRTRDEDPKVLCLKDASISRVNGGRRNARISCEALKV